jgi:hypothetical protein
LGNAEYIAIAGVFATVLGALITWLVMKRQFASKKLSYIYITQPIVRSDDSDLARDLKVFYRGEELLQPTLLSVEITNTGHVAIEDAEVVIRLPGAAYLISGYFVDVPAGYQMLWSIDRTNAEECTVKFKHINPKQIARVRFLMNEMPKCEPQIICPMPNVECIKASNATLALVPELIIQTVAPQILGGIRLK